MGKRWIWVAWSMLALFAVSVTVLCVLAVATGNIHQVPTDNAALLLAFTAFMVVGALIVAHRPGNPVGWIFSAIGLLSVTGALAERPAGRAGRQGWAAGRGRAPAPAGAGGQSARARGARPHSGQDRPGRRGPTRLRPADR